MSMRCMLIIIIISTQRLRYVSNIILILCSYRISFLSLCTKKIINWTTSLNKRSDRCFTAIHPKMESFKANTNHRTLRLYGFTSYWINSQLLKKGRH